MTNTLITNSATEATNIYPGILDDDLTVAITGRLHVTAWVGIDGALVVQIDTAHDVGRVRVNINDGAVFDADPEVGNSYLAGRAL